MSSDHAETVRLMRVADRSAAGPPSPSRARRLARILAIASGAACLAACAQSSVISSRTALAPNRQAALEHRRFAHVANTQHISVVRRHRAVETVSSGKAGEKAQGAAQGLASFYTEGTETASGEKFDTHELTAAHPSLPFGTHLRVTNVATGRSVTVRVNDRGPYVPGRVVDVSYSAAEALGMVGRGVAKVKLDVVQ